jgi:hypothetical protein
MYDSNKSSIFQSVQEQNIGGPLDVTLGRARECTADPDLLFGSNPISRCFDTLIDLINYPFCFFLLPYLCSRPTSATDSYASFFLASSMKHIGSNFNSVPIMTLMYMRYGSAWKL